MVDAAPFRAMLDALKGVTLGPVEPTLLSIGGRGYYENPASDLLAFFLQPDNAHGLGTLFIEALFEATGKELDVASLAGLRVEREVRTDQGNRIDLLLKAPGWMMLIENKIRHEQVNPVEDYETFAKQHKQEDDELWRIVLSPSGTSVWEDWEGLSYRNLIDALLNPLDACRESQSGNKWWHFAQDFIEHLKQELYPLAMTPETIEFVETHQNELADAVRLYRQYRAHLMAELPKAIDAACQSTGSYASEDSWCIRLRNPGWGHSEIAWSYNPEDRNRLQLTVYLEGVSEDQRRQAQEFFEGKHGMNYWTESGAYHCWRTRTAFDNRKEAEAALQELAEQLFTIHKAWPTKPTNSLSRTTLSQNW